MSRTFTCLRLPSDAIPFHCCKIPDQFFLPKQSTEIVGVDRNPHMCFTGKQVTTYQSSTKEDAFRCSFQIRQIGDSGLPRFGRQLIAEDSVLAEECCTREDVASQGLLEAAIKGRAPGGRGGCCRWIVDKSSRRSARRRPTGGSAWPRPKERPHQRNPASEHRKGARCGKSTHEGRRHGVFLRRDGVPIPAPPRQRSGRCRSAVSGLVVDRRPVAEWRRRL